MPKPAPRSDLALASSMQPCRVLAADLRPRLPGIGMPARLAEKRQLGTAIDENRSLSARIHALEAELDRRSAELAELRGELRGAVRDALTDPLTGLANRRAFDLELGARCARASTSSPAHLVMVDIDHFKRVNDAHGHDHGDAVLRIVGEIFRANLRRDGHVARLGGDEFGLLLSDASRRSAAGIAVRLCELLASRPLAVRGCPEVVERITLSIGVAECRGGESGACWYARADAALYEAKRAGRDRACIAPPAGRAS